MFKRRFRLPSSALVVAMLALAVALGGTAFAANSAAMKTKHKDKKADTKLIKKLAPTLSVKHAKTADSATTAANATHATTAGSATKATTATNATNAANAADLGGVPASSYVTNAGSIFVSTGASNWHTLNSTDPVSFFYGDNGTGATATTAGDFDLVAHPSFPTALYGKSLELTSATLCYSASTNAKIDLIEVAQNTYTNSGIGDNNIFVVSNKTRTGSACVVFPVSGTPAPLTSLDDISISLDVVFKSGGELDLGASGVTLTPTSTAATARRAGSS
jgi:hypothetical protein